MRDWLDIYGRDLAENPPTDDLVAFYFAANKWWTPPEPAPVAGDAAPTTIEAELWDCPFPETTE